MPVHVVLAGEWQAAQTTGVYSLAGCTVGPGFEFTDFQLLRDNLGPARLKAEKDPEASPFL